MRKLFFSALCCLIFLLQASCSTGETYAPVTDLSNIERIPKTGMYRVAKGETLYSISFRYGLDYRTLAEWNNIKSPYTIQRNQLISLRYKSAVRTHSPQKTSTPVVKENEPHYSVSKWTWPTRGKIINGFSANNKGINIAGQQAEAIYSVASGKVVYNGDGLRGYGNLIIIKHNNLYLSAYAHCRRSFVKDGEWVKQGQKIAEMGSTGTDKTMLHFEIRRAGIPVDPLSLFSRYN